MATSTTDEEIELSAARQLTSPNEPVDSTPAEDDVHNASPALPPVDGGKAAWRMLCTAFVFEALLWGFPLCFGVFQNYYSKLPEFQDSRFISVIGTVASGMSYMAAPVMIVVVKRFNKYRRVMIWVGCRTTVMQLWDTRR